MKKIPEIKEVYEVTTCPRCEAHTYERDCDYDLHSFDVYNKQDEYVGSVYPYNLEEMKEINKALKEGECPICDSWEDGLGRTLGHGAE